MKQSRESIALTEQIIQLRDSGLTWGQVGARVGRSRNICQQRYLAARTPSERARRKHAEALVETLRKEAGVLYKTLQEIRRDVHFAYRTEDSEHKWAELCMSIVAQIDTVTPNGTAGAKEAQRLWDEMRGEGQGE